MYKKIAAITVVIVTSMGLLLGLLFLSQRATASSLGPSSASRAAAAADPADLSIGSTTSPNLILNGQHITYTLFVTNSGPDLATQVVVTDVLPAEVSLVSAPLPQCSQTNPVRCSLGDMISETVQTIQIVALPNKAGTITNTAVVSSSVEDPNPINNRLADPALVLAAADLSTTVTAFPITPTIGLDVTYTITVTNHGPDAASNVEIVNTPPAGAPIRSYSPSQGNCVLADSSCTLGNLAADTHANIVAVAGPITDTSLIHSVSAQSATADPNLANNSSSAGVTARPVADVSVTKTASPSPVTAGQNINYTLVVTNAGPSQANTSLVDTLPSSLTLVSATPSQGICSGTSQISCSLEQMPALSSASVTIVASVSPAARGSILNTASISSNADDPDLTNNSASASTTVQASADLQVTASSNPISTVIAGNPLTYTVQVTNHGPSLASAVILTDTLPAGVTHISTTVPSQVTCSPPGTTPISCDLGSMDPGSTVNIIFRTSVDPSTQGLLNSHVVISSPDDENPANNSSSANITAQPEADLSITKTASPNPVTAGQNITYHLVASNAGPSQVNNPVLVDTLPSSLTLVSATPSQGICSGTSQISCSLEQMPALSSASVTIVASVSPAARGSILNTASISRNADDPNPANNSDSTSTTIQVTADLQATSFADPLSVWAGNPLTYTVRVNNPGPSLANNVQLVDTLPAGVTFLTATPSQGTCSGTAPVTCNLGAVNPASSASVILRTTVNPTTQGPLTNHAVVSSPDDQNTANNDTNISATADRQADLSIVAAHLPMTVTAGSSFAYLFTVRNFGPSTASDVTLVDPLPTGLTFASSIPASPTCGLSNGSVTCHFGTLAPNDIVEETLVVTASTTLSGTVNNQVSVSTTTRDPISSNNSATEIVKIIKLKRNPPQVGWVFPVKKDPNNNDFVSFSVGKGVNLKLQAVVTDTTGIGIGYVYFYRYDPPKPSETTGKFVYIGLVNNPPYEVWLDTTTLNPHWNQVIVQAYDTEGNPSAANWFFIYHWDKYMVYLPFIAKK